MKTGKFDVQLTTKQRQLLITASESFQRALLKAANKKGLRPSERAMTRAEAAQLEKATAVLRAAPELDGSNLLDRRKSKTGEQDMRDANALGITQTRRIANIGRTQVQP